MLDGLKKAANKIFNVKVTNKTPIPVTFQADATSNAGVEKLLRLIHGELKTHRREIETIRFAATSDVMQSVSHFHSQQVRSLRESLELLANSDVSLARFGDGEFRLMLLNDFNLRFQTNSPELQNDLREVFVSDRQDLLVGFPQLFRDAHWSGVYQELWPTLKELVVPSQRFVNAHLTRPQAFTILGEQAVQLWRQVWEGKKVAIITGEDSRFELIPELFDNMASHQIINSKSVNAYADLDRLVEVAKSSDADLALIALGPAGTILASRLASNGLRALDIGHLTNSYQNVFQGAVRPEAVPITRTKK